jgi:hypothetical protein
MARLFDLFDDKLKVEHELVTSVPVNLNTIGSGSDDVAQAIVNKIAALNRVNYRVDYSNFANFVFFNSALDYFNVSGERIINEYPYAGGFADRWSFQSSSDGYQQYLFDRWPKCSGVFSPSTASCWGVVDNQAVISGSVQHGILSSGTGSFTIEFWFKPPPVSGAVTSYEFLSFHDEALDGSPDPGFHLFWDTATVNISVSGSGGSAGLYTSTLANDPAKFYCFSFDNTNGLLSLFTGSNSERPQLVASSSFTPGVLLNQTSSIIFGENSAGGNRAAGWQLDNVRYWKTARSLSDVQVDYNTRVWASPNLYGSWMFDETPSGSINSLLTASDYSGFGADIHFTGTEPGWFAGVPRSIRTDGSLITSGSSEPIRDLTDPRVWTLVQEQQLSGTLYDKMNENIITRMFPEQYLLLEDEAQTEVLKNFLYVVGRQMDQLKVAIDQFVYVTKTNYGSFNQTPDSLLADIAKLYGWDFVGNFLNADALKYFFGRGVLSGSNESVPNQQLDVELYKIKNEFWRRTLNELMHIYKTKGTRESVESLIRVYGFDQKLVKLKEYGVMPNAGIQTQRINSHKSTTALWVDGGSVPELSPSAIPDAGPLNMDQEMWVRFPTVTTTDPDRSPTRETGSICYFSGSSWYATPQAEHWIYMRPLSGLSAITGTIKFIYDRPSTPNVTATFSDLPIFDGKWYHMTLRRYVSGTDSRVGLDIRRLREDLIDYKYAKEIPVPGTAVGWNAHGYSLMSSSFAPQGQYWICESRHWHSPIDEIFALTEEEIVDHTLNMFSWGIDEPGDPDDIEFRWQLNQSIDMANSSGTNYIAFDTTTNKSGMGMLMMGVGIDQSGTFSSGSGTYDPFLFDYNFIAPPEYGWNEDKIRVLSGTSVAKGDQFNQANAVALEFNLIDALNEDISAIIVSLQNFNNTIGQPANRYRDDYPDLLWYRHRYFDRLVGRINFRKFADMLEFFDRTFIKMVQRLLPARTNFLGDEFVVESHMLERPKHQYPYRRFEPEFQPEGNIVIVAHPASSFAGAWTINGGLVFNGFPLAEPLGTGSALPFPLGQSLGGF